MMLPLRSVAATFLAAAHLQYGVLAWNGECGSCPGYKPFKPVGCYERASLTFRSNMQTDCMTVENCAAVCKGNGFRCAGLAYYGACFCGASLQGSKVDDSQCSLPCTGNKVQTCGGDESLSVWEDATFLKAADDCTVSDYKPIGCFSHRSNEARPVPWSAKLDAGAVTTAACIAECRGRGFPYAGTEYGKECWCGTTLEQDVSPGASSECNMPCQGNKTEICGGRSRLSVYLAKDLLSSEPCRAQLGQGHEGGHEGDHDDEYEHDYEHEYEHEYDHGYGPPPSTSTKASKPPSGTAASAHQPLGPVGINSPPPGCRVITVCGDQQYPQTFRTASSKPTAVATGGYNSAGPYPTGGASASQLSGYGPDEGHHGYPDATMGFAKSQATLAVASGQSTPCPTCVTRPYINSMPIASSKSVISAKTQEYSPYVATASAALASSVGSSGVHASGNRSGTRTSASLASSVSSSSEHASGNGSGVRTSASLASLPTSRPPYGTTAHGSGHGYAPDTSISSKITRYTYPGSSSSASSSPSTSQTSPAQLPSTYGHVSPSPSIATSPTPYLAVSPSIASTTTPTKTNLTPSLCTVAATVTPACEYQVGDWCAPALPEWNDKWSCLGAYGACTLQVNSCFAKAGAASISKCWEYSKWCADVSVCCLDCAFGFCNKRLCKPEVVSLTTTVTPCPEKTATAVATKSCAPEPNSVCSGATNWFWKYGPGLPACGVPMPIVNCNDNYDDFTIHPLKLYQGNDSSKNWSFTSSNVLEACAMACKAQYDDCVKYDFWTCDAAKSTTSARSLPETSNKKGLHRRTDLAKVKCKTQYTDCLTANKWVTAQGECTKWMC